MLASLYWLWQEARTPFPPTQVSQNLGGSPRARLSRASRGHCLPQTARCHQIPAVLQGQAPEETRLKKGHASRPGETKTAVGQTAPGPTRGWILGAVDKSQVRVRRMIWSR